MCNNFSLHKVFMINNIPKHLHVYVDKMIDKKSRYYIYGNTPLCKYFMENGALQGEIIFVV